MSIRQLRILIGGLLAVVCVVLAGQLVFRPAAPRGGISVSFVGFTNVASGVTAGQFSVSNAFEYKLIFAAAAPEIRQTNRWSKRSHYGYPGNPVFTVAPHSAHTFAVVLSNVDDAAWRVPLAFDKVQTRIKRWSYEITTALHLPQTAQSPWMYTNTPEMFGISNYTVQRTQGEASFGDVLERQLPAPGYIAEKQFLLNLDNGELLTMPTNVWMAGISFSPRPSYNWMVKHGADLLVHSSEVSSNLTFHLDDGRLAILGTNVTFEAIAASDLNDLARNGAFQYLEIPRPEKGRGATLVFKTREGGLGVMQLLAFSAKPEPVLKLRYRLVRHETH